MLVSEEKYISEASLSANFVIKTTELALLGSKVMAEQVTLKGGITGKLTNYYSKNKVKSMFKKKERENRHTMETNDESMVTDILEREEIQLVSASKAKYSYGIGLPMQRNLEVSEKKSFGTRGTHNYFSEEYVIHSLHFPKGTSS